VSQLLFVNRRVAQSDQVLAQAQRVYRQLVDQETGLRGYVITGESDFLAPLRQVENTLQSSLAQLTQREATHPEQQRRVDELLAREAAWKRYAREVLTLQGPEQARQLVLSRRGKREMDQMRTVLETFIQEEQGHRDSWNRASQKTASASLLLGGGLTLGLGAILAVVSSRQLFEVARTYGRSVQQRAEGEARLGGVIGSAMDAILTVDSKQRITLFNAAAEQLFNCPAAEALGQSLDRFIPERFRADHPGWMEEFGVTDVTARTMGRKGELYGRKANGLEFPMEATISQVTVGGEKLYTVIIRDITERRRSEAKLRRSEERFRALVQNSQDIISILEADGTTAYVSPSITRALGYHPEELVGTNAYERIHPDERAQLREVFLATAAASTADNRYEFRVLNAAGSWRNMETVANNLLNDPQVGGVVFNCRDVTDRKVLEQQLQQSQKMDAVGRLAGGVAHDFNNMLAVITGYSELLQIQLQPEDPAVKLLREIQKAGDRAAGLTQQLLVFSRQQVTEPKLLDLRQVVSNFDSMLRRLIGEDIEVTVAPGTGVCYVRADAGQLEQVILNLAVNARDAMPRGGRLTLEIQCVELDQEYARHHLDVKPGRYAMLAISDTGCGMDAETQAHIFEPFFTTKARGAGTGLGLATVYGIVKQNGGDIWIYSELGKGTTFKVYLPEVGGDPSAMHTPLATEKPATGSETILLAEDEPMVRQLVRAVLEQGGYRVLEAADGAEALRLAEAHPGPIHLLLTDVVMPGISGRELTERLAKQRPEVRVVYMSGYTDDAVVRHGVLHAGVAFIQKPFAPSALLRKVQEVLGQGTAQTGK
jgi:PAS domain S-box-containing protein